jgi:L-asparaginase
MNQQPIQIFVTGGTFDKQYNELTGELFFKQTHIADMLKLGRCRLDLAVETLMMIDSLQMTDAGRQLILERCESSPASRIVITHGTDSMEHTAAVLGRGIRGKTIVLTGPWCPTSSAAPMACSIWAPRWPSCRRLTRACTWL